VMQKIAWDITWDNLGAERLFGYDSGRTLRLGAGSRRTIVGDRGRPSRHCF